LEQQIYYDAAIYCRLSRDDDIHGESSSILTQKAMLSKYVQEQNWRIIDYYVDDGISGTTYDRPDFKRMIRDIEEGKINLVITKDLSRLGRDYIQTGYYTEIYFTEKNVRYIALNDGIDTINSDNDIAPFKNILNEMYAKDISRKVKSAYKIKAARGDHHGAYAPFGYKKHPEIKGKIIVDYESAEVVRLIFKLASQGYGASRIRTELTRRKILTPSAYLNKLNSRYYGKEFINAKPEKYYSWSMNAVQRILQNEIYIGNVTHYKEISVSYKSKRRQPQSKDKWITVIGSHEPIVDKETWDVVQDKARRRVNLGASHEPNIFARIARCADCGWSMGLTPRQIDFKTKKRTERRYLQCSTNRVYGKTRCTLYNTNYQKLCDLVFDDIKAFSKIALENSEELLLMLTASSDKKKLKDLEQAKKDLAKTKQRLNDLELLLQRLFEQNVSGKISDYNYSVMFKKYQKEQETQRLREKELIARIEANSQSVDNASKWIELIKQYVDIQELDSIIVNELIEKILIHEAKKENGKRIQKIEIYYRFIGKASD